MERAICLYQFSAASGTPRHLFPSQDPVENDLLSTLNQTYKPQMVPVMTGRTPRTQDLWGRISYLSLNFLSLVLPHIAVKTIPFIAPKGTF